MELSWSTFHFERTLQEIAKLHDVAKSARKSNANGNDASISRPTFGATLEFTPPQPQATSEREMSHLVL